MANPTADALHARAKALRAELTEETNAARSALMKEVDVLRRDAEAADGAAAKAQAQIESREVRNRDLQKSIRSDELAAVEADQKGIPQEAARIRQSIEERRATIADNEARIVADKAALAEAKQSSATHTARADKLMEDGQEAHVRQQEASKTIDAMEAKATYLEEADGHDAKAVELRAEAAALRAKGQDIDADEVIGRAAAEEYAASAKRGSADEQVIDDAAIAAAGLEPIGPIPATQPTTQPTTASVMAEPAGLSDEFDQLAEGTAVASDVRSASSAEGVGDGDPAPALEVPPIDDITAPVDPGFDKAPAVDPGLDQTPTVDPGFDRTPTVDPGFDQTPAVDPGFDPTLGPDGLGADEPAPEPVVPTFEDPSIDPPFEEESSLPPLEDAPSNDVEAVFDEAADG